jgi:spore germination protein KC
MFVLTVAVDKAEKIEHGYKVSVKLGIPQRHGSPSKENFQILSEESDSISAAIQLIQAQVDKQLDFGHAKALILGKSLVNEDYREALDWQRYIQSIAWMGVGMPSALDVLTVEPKSEELPANALFLSFGKTGNESQYVVSVHMFEFYRNSKENGVTPILPLIKAKESRYEINQACLFDDKELIMTLSPDHTRLLNLISERIDKADIKLSMQNHLVDAHIDGFRVSHSLHLTSTQPVITMQIKATGALLERSRGIHFNKQTFEQASKNLASQLESNVTALLKDFQEYRVDPLGFGLTYRSTQWGDVDEEWKQWQRIYPKVKFQVQATVELRSSGATT